MYAVGGMFFNENPSLLKQKTAKNAKRECYPFYRTVLSVK